jgi:small-conductance mechanosensitive channel
MVTGFISMMMQFLAIYLNGIFLWTLLLLVVKFGMSDIYIRALFYLASIPLWLFYVNRFIRYAKAVNKAQDYQLAGQKYQGRFFFILSVLLSSTIVLIFLQKVIVKVLPYSDVPRILQAINFIIFQVSLILMISREQFIMLIPSNTSFGKWLQDFVNRYYYLFLAGFIVIIVMSNPYIGYGTNFLYLLFRIALIMLLVPVIVTVHNKLKSVFAKLFFEYDEEGVLNERFPYARSSYGLLIIGSFIFFSFLVFLIASNIWGFEVGFKEILSWLRKDLWSYRSAETGRLVAINAISLVRMLVYLIIGTAIALLINKYMIRRMFDLLMIESGVQGIILSLTRYVIILAALIIGLQGIGLGQSLLWYVLAIIGGLGVAGKEIVADVLGYFMILIQRPIKIGDFIKVDADLIGVVRHLNLRSVVIRRKNSLTILVPNSYLLSRPLVNWNYYRTYFAFNDIFITVSYKADPQKVKELFLKVLDENYNVLRNPAPIVRLNDFTESGFLFLVRGFLSHDKVLDQYDIASDVRLELIRTMREHGFAVGVPSRQLKPEFLQEEELDKV